MTGLPIRSNLRAEELRRLSGRQSDARVARHLLAIANALDGMKRAEAAQSAGMDRQALRDWVICYNEVGADGLADRWDQSRPPGISESELVSVKAKVL